MTFCSVQFDRTMRNIERGMELFNENTEALEHNFLTRGNFRKLEKEKKGGEKLVLKTFLSQNFLKIK